MGNINGVNNSLPPEYFQLRPGDNASPPSEFSLEDIPENLSNFDMNHDFQITPDVNREYEFEIQGPTFETQPLTREEFQENVENFLESSLGENGANIVKGAAAVGYVLSEGKIEFSSSTEDFIPNSEFEFEVGTDRLQVGWGMKF